MSNISPDDILLLDKKGLIENEKASIKGAEKIQKKGFELNKTQSNTRRVKKNNSN